MSFHDLHRPGDPLVLYNLWDAGSARVVAGTGAAAVATGSWSVAAAHGYEDGEQIPLDLLLTIAGLIVGSVDVPVSVDLETGYGATPEDVGRTVERVAALGVAGVNLEDQVLGEDRVPEVGAQV